jgi:hypothetical protein
MMFTICSEMTAAAEVAEIEPAPADWARPLLDRQLRLLGDLAEIGLELARAVEAEARGPEADVQAAVLAYSRIARAVRQTVMLQSRLIRELQAEERGEAAQAATLRARRAEVKQRLSRIFRRAIEAEHDQPERIERLRAEAAERLEDELVRDLLDRPVAEIIADICRDLGLSPDWRGLADDIADAEAVLRGEEPEQPTRLEVRWLPTQPPPRNSS